MGYSAACWGLEQFLSLIFNMYQKCSKCSIEVPPHLNHVCMTEWKQCAKCFTRMVEDILFTGKYWKCPVCDKMPEKKEEKKCPHGTPFSQQCQPCWFDNTSPRSQYSKYFGASMLPAKKEYTKLGAAPHHDCDARHLVWVGTTVCCMKCGGCW